MGNETMGQAEWFSLVVGIVGLLIGVIGTCFAVYQTAVVNESKKRRVELQYLLAGVSNLALSKCQAWLNQGNFIGHAEDSTRTEVARVIVRAKDDFSEIYSLSAALEKSIDSENSAITEMLEQTVRQMQLNNKIQEEASQNPSVQRQG